MEIWLELNILTTGSALNKQKILNFMNNNNIWKTLIDRIANRHSNSPKMIKRYGDGDKKKLTEKWLSSNHDVATHLAIMSIKRSWEASNKNPKNKNYKQRPKF